MNRIFPMLIFCFAGLFASAQADNEKFNKKLADSLGADEYGMKSYTFVILKSKENKLDKKVRDSLMIGYMENIGRLAASGKLVVAGPMGKNDKGYRGIFILNTSDLTEAKSLLDSDPSIKGGIFDTEIFPWYGSAALAMYIPYSEVVGKKKM